MKLLLTGAGSLAEELIRQLKNKAERLVIYSRNEARQADLRAKYGEDNLRYFIGNIRDTARLSRAMMGIDYVIHTAALKRVESGEYNPCEFVKTNIIGSMNVVEACNTAGIKKCILTSTDKAVNPVNLYGATKMCAEKTFISSNNLGTCRFSVCRYGNVKGSRGSVIPVWTQLAKEGKPITITDKRMSRFWITIKDAAKFIIHKFEIMEGGEIFLPILESQTMLDVAVEIVKEHATSSVDIKEVGVRPGEKIHESLINEEEIKNCYIKDNCCVVYPAFHDWRGGFNTDLPKIPQNFFYLSGKND